MSTRGIWGTMFLALAITAVVIALTGPARTATTAHAFDSYPTGADHDQITEKAAKDAGLNKKTRNALKKAVRDPDWKETDWGPIKGLHPNKHYKANHHCDRGPDVSDADAFKATAKYIRAQKQAAISHAKAGDKKAAVKALGRALHALQDCKSHTNFIDLTPAEQAQFEKALADGKEEPPPGLKVTGYDPKADDPGRPADDDYAHDDKAKDKKKTAQEKKNNKKAFDEAVRESLALILMVKNSLATDQWDDFRTTTLAPNVGDEQYAWAHRADCGPDGCSVSSHGSSVQFPPGLFEVPEEVAVLGVPRHFFVSSDSIIAPDGAEILIYREIRPEEEVFNPPAHATVSFSPMEVFSLDTGSLRAYFWEPEFADWVAISGSSVDAWEGIAAFSVAKGGTYGIGGQPKLSEADVELSTYEIQATSESGAAEEAFFEIENLGDITLTWDLASEPGIDWVSLSQSFGTIAGGQTALIGLSFDGGGLSPGLHQTMLSLTSNDTDEPLVLVTLILDVKSAGQKRGLLSASGTINRGENHDFVLEMPPGAQELIVTLSGDGDADLYVKFGSPISPNEFGRPHDGTFFKAPYLGGSAEVVTFDRPSEGLWYVTVRGYDASSGYNLVASLDEANGPTLENGRTATGFVARGENHDYVLVVAPGTGSLTVKLSGDGDADLYVKYGSPISQDEFGRPHDEAAFKAPYLGGSVETVSFNRPSEGLWYVTVRGYNTNSDYSLVASWSP